MLPWAQLMSLLPFYFYWKWYFQASVDLHLVNQIVSSQHTSYVIFSSIWLITNSFLKYHLLIASCFGCEGAFVFTFGLLFTDQNRIHLLSLLWWFSVPDPNIEKTSPFKHLIPWMTQFCTRLPAVTSFEFPSVACNSSLFRLTLICPPVLNPSHAVSHFCGNNSIPSNINT